MSVEVAPAGERQRWCADVLALLAGGPLVLLTPRGAEPVQPEDGLPGVAVSCGAADGGLLAVGGVTGHVEAWFGGGPVYARHRFRHGRVSAVAVCKERGLLAAGGQNWLSVVHLGTGSEVWTAHGPPEATDVRFDDGDRALLCGFADGRVARWVPGEAPAWTDPHVPGARDEWVILDRRHAAAGRDRRMVVWRLGDRRPVFEAAEGSTTPWWPVARPILPRRVRAVARPGDRPVGHGGPSAGARAGRVLLRRRPARVVRPGVAAPGRVRRHRVDRRVRQRPAVAASMGGGGRCGLDAVGGRGARGVAARAGVDRVRAGRRDRDGAGAACGADPRARGLGGRALGGQRQRRRDGGRRRPTHPEVVPHARMTIARPAFAPDGTRPAREGGCGWSPPSQRRRSSARRRTSRWPPGRGPSRSRAPATSRPPPAAWSSTGPLPRTGSAAPRAWVPPGSSRWCSTPPRRPPSSSTSSPTRGPPRARPRSWRGAPACSRCACSGRWPRRWRRSWWTRRDGRRASTCSGGRTPPPPIPSFRRRAYRAALDLYLGLDAWMPKATLWSGATASWEGLANLVLTAPEAERWRALGAFGPDHPWADVDDDGVSNDVERAFGRDPAHPDPTPLGPLPVTALHWPAGSDEDVAALRGALSAAHGRAAGLLGRRVDPLVVRVASGPTFADGGLDPATRRASGARVAPPHSTEGALGPAVTLGEDLADLVRARDWAALATTAVALHLAWSSSVHDLGAAEALARDLSVRPMPATGLAPFDDLDWQRAARACPAGWRGLLDHTCPPPTPDPPEPAEQVLPR